MVDRADPPRRPRRPPLPPRTRRRWVLAGVAAHLPELFLVTPTGSWLAPNVAEVRMNPGDHAYLTEVMDRRPSGRAPARPTRPRWPSTRRS
jgi:hypothetical protein